MHGAETSRSCPILTSRLRLNDGKCDPFGRLWVSTYSPTGMNVPALFQLEADGLSGSNWTS